MPFSLSRYRLLDPNTDGGGGGGAGAGDGGGAPGGSPASTPASKAELENLSQSIRGLSQKFDGHLSDYSRRFAPANAGSDNADKGPEQEPTLERYENTQQGITKYLADFNKFHTKKNWTEHTSAAERANKANAAKAARQTSIGAHVKRMGEAMKRYPDFEGVIQNAAIPLPDGANGAPDVLGAVLESEFSADLHYHLSKNPGDLYRLVNAFNQSERAGARGKSVV